MQWTQGVKKEIKVEYIHTTGEAGMRLRWSGPNPTNVIHYNYLTPDIDALSVSNENSEIETEIPTELKLSQTIQTHLTQLLKLSLVYQKWKCSTQDI